MLTSLDNPNLRDNPFWRLPDVATALSDASSQWSSGAAAALTPLRRANQMLQTSGYAGWWLHGECLVQAIADAAYGAPVSADALRNALREFEREIWHAGAPASEPARLWDGAPTLGERLAAGWPITRARTPKLSSAALPLRQSLERALLALLRPDANVTQTGETLGQLFDLAADLHRLGGHAPLDYWRLATAWLGYLRTRSEPLSLPVKRLAGRMNLVLRRQLMPPESATSTPANESPVVGEDPGRDLVLMLATWQANQPSAGFEPLLADFGVLSCGREWPAALTGLAASTDQASSGPNSYDWLRFGPLAVRLDVCQNFLSLADEALPNLAEPAVAARVADYADAIGLTSVARLALALAVTGERLAMYPAARPGGPAALATGVKALRGMLHQFAADAYPEPRPDLIADLAEWREGALDAAAGTRRPLIGDGVPC